MGPASDALKEAATVIPAAPGWHYLIAFEPMPPDFKWTALAENIVGWRVTHMGGVEPVLVSGYDCQLLDHGAIRAPDGAIHMYDGLFDSEEAWLASLAK